MLQDDEGNKFIEGLSSDRQVEDVTLEGQDLENLIDKYIRPTRDQLLKDTDALWIEKSSKGEDLTALNTYKQALRDFPSNVDLSSLDFTDEIVFPVLGG